MPGSSAMPAINIAGKEADTGCRKAALEDSVCGSRRLAQGPFRRSDKCRRPAEFRSGARRGYARQRAERAGSVGSELRQARSGAEMDRFRSGKLGLVQPASECEPTI